MKSTFPARLAFGSEEIKAIQEVFAYYRRQGLDCGYQDYFEKKYTDLFITTMSGKGYADAVCSGTAALFIAIASLQLKPGSHVLVSAITDPGTISAIILNNLVPVLVDNAKNSYNMGVDEFKSRIKNKTKAVVVVHMAGKSAPISKISKIAKDKGIFVIEDCSQSHGAKCAGKKVGTFGDAAAFSTMYRKTHSTGGCGGVVFTKDKRRYDLIRAYADRGKPFYHRNFNEKDPSSFLFPALNLNIDEISCAIGINSLSKLNDTIKSRLTFLFRLKKELERKSKVCKISDLSRNDSPFFQPVFVDISKISCSKIEFAEALKKEGIPLNSNYRYVVCEWSWAKRFLGDNFVCRNAIQIKNRTFNLLLNENYGENEIKLIIRTILKIEKIFCNSTK